MNAIHFYFAKAAILGLMISAIVGCGGGDATVTPNFVNAAGAPARNASMLASLRDPIRTYLTRYLDNRVTQVGQTTATSITSLQYYIQSIQLCESITTNGTAYSNPSGCVTLYEPAGGAVDDGVYNSYTVTDAVADTTAGHYIDFLSEAGRAALAQATAVSSGTYNYALINFMRPIKIKAEFKNTAGTSIHYTKASTNFIASTDDGGREVESIVVADSKTGPAELMTYMLNNGGVWFPMLKPFTIATGESIFLDFVFNPESFATTSETTAGSVPSTTAPNTYDETNGVTFNLPYAKMAPVPRKAGQTTKKEVYLVNYTTGTSASKIRIELYFNSADAEKSILGADATVVMDVGATESAMNIVQTYKVSEAAGVVSFKGFSQTTGQIDADSVTGLTRRTSGTLNLFCNFVSGPCSVADGSTVAMTYTYVGEADVD